MKTVAIVQARWGSSRLPGKVLLPLGRKTALEHVVERARRAPGIDQVVVASSVETRDLRIAQLCARESIPLYLGSEEDVLDRYYQAARLYQADRIVRITADCPVIDPAVIGSVVAAQEAAGCDYASNTIQETFPDGQDAEVFTFAALERAWKEASLPSEREHVTPYMKKNPQIFSQKSVTHSEDLSGMRWTLDQKEDYALLKKIYAALHKKGKIFGMGQIIRFLSKHPKIAEINSGIRRNEGYRTSLRRDGLAANKAVRT